MFFWNVQNLSSFSNVMKAFVNRGFTFFNADVILILLSSKILRYSLFSFFTCLVLLFVSSRKTKSKYGVAIGVKAERLNLTD